MLELGSRSRKPAVSSRTREHISEFQTSLGYTDQIVLKNQKDSFHFWRVKRNETNVGFF